MMPLGLALGVFLYSVTTFPVAYFTGWEGDAWLVVCFSWGVVCGFGGMAVAVR